MLLFYERSEELEGFKKGNGLKNKLKKCGIGGSFHGHGRTADYQRDAECRLSFLYLSHFLHRSCFVSLPKNTET